MYGNANLWFDPTAYRPVTDARFGTSGFDSLRGPGFVNTDLGLFRNFKVSERFELQFRAEAFNITNTPHLGQPNSNVSAVQYGTLADGSPNYNQIENLNGFGQITSVRSEGRPMDERYFRLGVKIRF